MATNLNLQDERYSFLDITNGGETAFVIGVIYPDQELLMDSDEWVYEAESLKNVVTPQGEDGNPLLTKDFVNKCKDLFGSSHHPKPSTPPFIVVSGVKRTTKFSGGVPFSSVEHKSIIVESKDKFVPTEKAGMESSIIQKLRLRGAEDLSTEELLEIALDGVESVISDNNVIKDSNKIGNSDSTIRLASRIISEYGSRAVASETNPSLLAETMQIPLATASKIVSIFALGKRFFQGPVGRYPVIRNEDDVFRYLHDMKDLKKEHLRGLYFNVQMRLIHDEVISIGTLSRAIVHPREIFSPALEFSASSVILVHNHPSGGANPSERDISLTRQLSQVGRIMGIELTDHIIIGSNGYTSMKVAGII